MVFKFAFRRRFPQSKGQFDSEEGSYIHIQLYGTAVCPVLYYGTGALHLFLIFTMATSARHIP